MAVPCTAVAEQTEKVSFDSSKQKTLKKSVSISGIGLFTAESAVLTIHPAPSSTGLLFQRSDLPDKPILEADLDHVVGTPRCTILGKKNFTIHTVEHVLAALRGMGIDNALLELSGPEIPIMDGSAMPFVEAILEGEITQQEEEKDIHFLRNPVTWSQGDVHLVAIPADELSISYTLHFPQSKILRSQYLQAPVSPAHFSKEIAPCRTFCLYEEIAPFLESGLIKGGGLDNAVIIKNDIVINPDGIRFSDEMVRHKILDLIGDLSLIPDGFAAHILAVRSGHASNIAFARKLYNQIKMEKT
ncbi:MAG: UDP-3-O-acyl-N-acetylglucosamine deacetylase [Chlamydiae bacterium]|nr:UDP-3-O-acyl-N-acetylglucosamine deacetylase [Chlamydiota bacterium]